MSRADYAHWNEDADWMWWQEEGRHPSEPDYDPDDYLPDDRPRIDKQGVCTWCDDDDVHCEICGEHIKHRGIEYIDEVGEFWNPTEKCGVLAHAQCGIDAGLELA